MDASFSNLRSYSEVFVKLVHASDTDILHSWDLKVDLTNTTEARFMAIFERVTDDKNTEKVIVLNCNYVLKK